MSFDRSHIYNIKFSLKSFEANCHRSYCKVHAYLKIQNQERKFTQIADMKKNMAVFNTELDWELVTIKYDDVSGMYDDKNAIVSIHYQTSESGMRTNKIKVGQVTLNLGTILNSRSYRINNVYNLEKCYDQAAKLKVSVDFTRIEEAAIQGAEGIASNEYQRIRQSMMYKNSKMRERMIDDQKNLLQQKLFEYEDKLEKYRDTHSDQLKKLSEQLQKKQEKLNSVIMENNTILTSLQNAQISNERNKNRVTVLEQQNAQLKESNRHNVSQKQSLSRQVGTLTHQIDTLHAKIDQMEKARDKKEAYYKQEVQKYNVKYIDSENNRNKIVFELENKLKDQLEKKDAYYKDLIEKLQQKMYGTNHSSKETLYRKDKQIVMLNEKIQSMTKDIKSLNIAIQENEEQKQSMHTIKTRLESQIEGLRSKMKGIEDQLELALFSSDNLSKQVHRQKMENKKLLKTNEELRFEIDLANKTMEQNEKTIVKMSREIQVFKERQYYMEQKFQDQLEIKTYNEQCMRGTAAHYRNELKKYTHQIKMHEDRIDELQTTISSQNGEKQKMSEQLKKQSKAIYENNHQIMKMQSQITKYKQKCQELSAVNHQKQIIINQLRHKLQNQTNARGIEVQDCITTINDLQDKIKKANLHHREEKYRIKSKYQNEIQQKNHQISDLQAEISRISMEEKVQREINQQKQQRELELDGLLKSEREKLRILQRQQLKSKFDVSKVNEDIEYLRKDEKRIKTELKNTKNELSDVKNNNQKLIRKLAKQKDSYVEIIKWILERTAFRDTKQFVQSVDGDIELQFITLINNGLERMYSDWDKVNRTTEQLREENERVMDQLSRQKLQLQYHLQNSKGQSFVDQIAAIKERISANNTYKSVPDMLGTESIKIQQLRGVNKSLQKQITQKTIEIESLTHQLFQQRQKVNSLNNEIRTLKEDIEQLNIKLTKKTMSSNSFRNDFDRDDELYQPYKGRSPRHSDYKTQIESKFREQKAITQLQSKLQQAEREDSLQKAKIQLLESKLKTATELNKSYQDTNRRLMQDLRSRENTIINLKKQIEEMEKNHEKVNKDVQLFGSKISKKQAEIEELRNQIDKLRKTNDSLSKQIQQSDSKYLQRQKQLQKDALDAKRALIDLKETYTNERMQKQKNSLQQNSQINSLKTTAKEGQRRVTSLQGLLKKSKDQYEELYQKHLSKLSELNECQQKIKDLQMNVSVLQNNYEKQIQQLRGKLTEKQYELQEVKFTNESKVIQLERELQDLRR